MIQNIEPLPKIPEPLRIAAAQGTLIPFIGAGVSLLGGCPSWSDFANKALNFFVEQGKLNHAQMDQISTLSPRVKLSLALELEKKYEISIDFKKLLTPPEKSKKAGIEVYANLSKLAKTFVTTNYDDWLDQTLPMTLQAGDTPSSSNSAITARQLFCKPSNISVENLDTPNAVFHIHGSIKDRENMVLTTVDYLDLYSSHRIDVQENQENPFLTFLQTLFQLKNVLFVGYGLEELEILEYIVQKGIEKLPDSDEEPRHYVLKGFFSHEIELAKSLDSYFSQFGIGLLPFSRDENGWHQLVEVIEYLSKEVPPRQQLKLSKRQEMEELL